MISWRRLDAFHDIDRTVKAGEKEHVEGWIKFADGSGEPLLYYKYWLMVKYCMDVKKMRYNQLIDDTLPEEAVWKQVMDWYRLQEK